LSKELSTSEKSILLLPPSFSRNRMEEEEDWSSSKVARMNIDDLLYI
jgi:hypothetical protein